MIYSTCSAFFQFNIEVFFKDDWSKSVQLCCDWLGDVKVLIGLVLAQVGFFAPTEFQNITFGTRQCVSCPLVLVCVLVHFHFNLVSSVLAAFQIGQLRWCEMMIEIVQSFQNRTGRRNDKSARGHYGNTGCGVFKPGV